MFNGRQIARTLAEEGRWGEITHSGRLEPPIGNSIFKIQDDREWEMPEGARKSKPGKIWRLATPHRPSQFANRRLAIVNRQVAIGRNWASPRAAKRKNSFFISTEAGMLLKTNKTRTEYMACEQTFSAQMHGFCNNQAQFCPLLVGESRCFGRTARDGSASNGASQGPLKRTDASECKSHVGYDARLGSSAIPQNSKFKIQDLREFQIGNFREKSNVGTR